MAEKDKFLATFRINQDEWKDFMAIAKAGGSSASAVLVDFIQWYRAGNRIAADTKSSTLSDNLDSVIDSRIEAKLSQLVSRGSQPHPANLDTILDERDRHLESRLLSILETMLETLLDNKLEELESRNVRRAENGETLRLEMEELILENETLQKEKQELRQELSNAAPTMPALVEVRERVLKSLTSGKSKVATTSPQYKTAVKVLDRFISELRESTPTSKPASSTPDGTAAPLVSEATKKLSDKHYTKDEYYTELRQIVERCGYRLFIDNTTLGRGRELFIVNPPGVESERIISTQDVGEVVDWLRKQDLTLSPPVLEAISTEIMERA